MTAPTTNLAEMVMERNQASGTNSQLRKGDSSVSKGSNQKKGKAKGMKSGKIDKKGMGMNKSGVKGMGMNKGGKGNGSGNGGGVVERKCAVGQNNLVFTIFPDRENLIVMDVQAPAAGFILVFDGDFIGIQTQTLLILAGGVIAQGQDSFVFFDPTGGDEVVGSIAVAFGNNIPVITGGTGIFLGADGAPVLSQDNESEVLQLLFDICVSAL